MNDVLFLKRIFRSVLKIKKKKRKKKRDQVCEKNQIVFMKRKKRKILLKKSDLFLCKVKKSDHIKKNHIYCL